VAYSRLNGFRSRVTVLDHRGYPIRAIVNHGSIVSAAESDDEADPVV
jgi:hypothetical protein